MLSKLRGAGEPSDAAIEALALSHGFNKSDEHWGSRYYTELGQNLFSFARELLSRYAAPQASAEAEQYTTGDDDLDMALNLVGAPGDYAIAQADAIERLKERLKPAPAVEYDQNRENGIAGKSDTYTTAPAKGAGDVALPPLPEPEFRGVVIRKYPRYLFTGDQMQDYARAAVLADRQQRGGDVGELREAAKTFYNATIADTTVRISTTSAKKRDGVIAAGERLLAALAATKGESK
ncbi:hypothetical protein [Bordetella genomosp. 4]|uniref:Uncharacterized protein n=1 Tax=Bordetella genomosp. 4 TaxID=463044 RepID=A0A261U7M1_9BORD|nr:hypothetical protein [Bordetella genomosp. 4]OZI57625.1 hypothetical protein CAL20_09620 [Bordetella genomosp. 4]